MQKNMKVVYSTIKTLQRSFNDSKEKINKKQYTVTFLETFLLVMSHIEAFKKCSSGHIQFRKITVKVNCTFIVNFLILYEICNVL